MGEPLYDARRAVRTHRPSAAPGRRSDRGRRTRRGWRVLGRRSQRAVRRRRVFPRLPPPAAGGRRPRLRERRRPVRRRRTLRDAVRARPRRFRGRVARATRARPSPRRWVADLRELRNSRLAPLVGRRTRRRRSVGLRSRHPADGVPGRRRHRGERPGGQGPRRWLARVGLLSPDRRPRGCRPDVYRLRHQRRRHHVDHARACARRPAGGVGRSRCAGQRGCLGRSRGGRLVRRPRHRGAELGGAHRRGRRRRAR